MDSRLRGNDGERFARMTGTHDCVVIDLSLSFLRRRESIKAHQSWNTRDPHHSQQTQRNALHIGVINNLKKRVRVAGAPLMDTNKAPHYLSRLFQSMRFDDLVNSWFVSSMFSDASWTGIPDVSGCFPGSILIWKFADPTATIQQYSLTNQGDIFYSWRDISLHFPVDTEKHR